MDKDQIIRASHDARVLARRIADLVLSSDVPPAHWDEVSERVLELLGPHVALTGEDACCDLPSVTYLAAE